MKPAGEALATAAGLGEVDASAVVEPPSTFGFVQDNRQNEKRNIQTTVSFLMVVLLSAASKVTPHELIAIRVIGDIQFPASAKLE